MKLDVICENNAGNVQLLTDTLFCLAVVCSMNLSLLTPGLKRTSPFLMLDKAETHLRLDISETNAGADHLPAALFL